jgi:hypothetical protein
VPVITAGLYQHGDGLDCHHVLHQVLPLGWHTFVPGDGGGMVPQLGAVAPALLVLVGVVLPP